MGDSLILKVEEYDSQTQTIVNTIYVLYDKYNYILRGEKTRQPTGVVIPYSFNCSDTQNLADFICMTTKYDNELQYSLYVHSDLPIESAYITYETLTRNLKNGKELTDNKNEQQPSTGLMTVLLIIKNVFNSY